jgi:diketogulonate reductase-like aldo/keto reductase
VRDEDWRVFQVPPEDTAENVLQAIEMGYRHIDTAKARWTTWTCT